MSLSNRLNRGNPSRLNAPITSRPPPNGRTQRPTSLPESNSLPDADHDDMAVVLQMIEEADRRANYLADAALARDIAEEEIATFGLRTSERQSLPVAHNPHGSSSSSSASSTQSSRINLPPAHSVGVSSNPVNSSPQASHSRSRSDAAIPRYTADEAMARRLARSWRVESLQSTLLTVPPSKDPTPYISTSQNRLPSDMASKASTSRLNRSENNAQSRTTSLRPSSIITTSTTPSRTSSEPRRVQDTKPQPNQAQATRNVDGSTSDTRQPSSRSPTPRVTQLDTIRIRSFDSSGGITSEPLQPTHVSQNDPVSEEVRNPRGSEPTKNLSPDVGLLHFRDLFTADRLCSKCNAPIKSRRGRVSFSIQNPPLSLLFLLHALCPSCSTNHCRGCGIPASCPPTCSGRPPCCITSCCPEVRAIAIFEILGSFDVEYLGYARIAGQDGREARQDYNDLVSSRAETSTIKWEGIVVRALNTLSTFLSLPSPESSQHPAVRHIFSLSYLPEVLESLLRNNDVSDWVAHSDMYCAMLSILKSMVGCGLADVLTEPLRKLNQSCGVERWMWGDGQITWERACGDTAPYEIARATPLCGFIQELERHRMPLMVLASQIHFPPTVNKLHTLCDGILYLLLQQMVGAQG